MTEPFVIFVKPTVCIEFSVWEDTSVVPAAGFLADGEDSGLRMKPASGREEVCADLGCERTGAVIDMMLHKVCQHNNEKTRNCANHF